MQEYSHLKYVLYLEKSNDPWYNKSTGNPQKFKGRSAFMTYGELQKAYEAAMKKCSELEQKIEEKDLRIEHLTELVLKRNKMLFGQKSEKAKFINDGQLAFEGIFNVTRKSNKTGQHRGRKEIRADLETKKIVYELSEDQRICEECGDTLIPYSEEYITTRIAVIPEKVYKIEYYRKVYKCKNCDKNGIKSNIVKAENQTPACIIEKGLPDASLVADIMQRKYQLGEPLYRQEQYWKLRGIYLNRTSLANWVIKGAKWFEPLIRQLWAYAYLEPVLNADETPTRVLKKDGKPTKKKSFSAATRAWCRQTVCSPMAAAIMKTQAAGHTRAASSLTVFRMGILPVHQRRSSH